MRENAPRLRILWGKLSVELYQRLTRFPLRDYRNSWGRSRRFLPKKYPSWHRLTFTKLSFTNVQVHSTVMKPPNSRESRHPDKIVVRVRRPGGRWKSVLCGLCDGWRLEPGWSTLRVLIDGNGAHRGPKQLLGPRVCNEVHLDRDSESETIRRNVLPATYKGPNQLVYI
jgi:hypothetical protein